MSRFKLLDRLRGSVLAGSVGTSASEDKLLSSRESHPGVIPDYPGLSRIKTFDRAQRIMFRGPLVGDPFQKLVARHRDFLQGDHGSFSCRGV